MEPLGGGEELGIAADRDPPDRYAEAGHVPHDDPEHLSDPTAHGRGADVPDRAVAEPGSKPVPGRDQPPVPLLADGRLQPGKLQRPLRHSVYQRHLSIMSRPGAAASSGAGLSRAERPRRGRSAPRPGRPP